MKKSQAILIYAVLIEAGLLYLQITYLHHPFANTQFLTDWLWFLPTLLVINVLFFLFGFYCKARINWHMNYTIMVVLYYGVSLMLLPVVVGILNIANGVIFVGTTLISMILFPKRVVYFTVTACGLVYLISAWMTVEGYLDYALALRPYVLIHPEVEKMYIVSSMFYSFIYAALTIYLFDMCLRVWQEKEFYKDQLSCTDELTQVLNRRGMNRMVELQMQQTQIAAKETALVMVDIDDFKKVNDRYGHQQGDIVLKAVAETLKHNLRSSDMVSRYGGEEFMIMLPFTTIEQAEQIAEVCRLALQNHQMQLPNGELLSIRASFGVSSTQKSGFDFEELFHLADQALYRAKRAGKNQVKVA